MPGSRTEFVHLHLHTQYSLLDAMNRSEAVAKAVRKRGMRAVGITDHGNLFGAVDFYRTVYAQGVKPIIGCEVYVAPGSRHEKEQRTNSRGFHLTLLAISADGYRNLVKLSSLGYTEGFYYNPRIDRELLDAYSEGLIAFSGCLSGEVARKFLAGDSEGARRALRTHRDIFGKSNYFIELQDHGLDDQRELMKFLLEASKQDGIPTVATNDVHYLDREDSAAHDALLCIGTRRLLTDTDRKRYGADQFYLKSPEEMARLFDFAPEALSRTVEIADRAELDLEFNRHHLPAFPVPKGFQDENTYLKEVSKIGLAARFGSPSSNYTDRLEHELEVIVKKGFAGYFLIVADFIREARARGIPVGPGRGSAAGSLTAYALGITEVDPLRWGLLFERFLNPERSALPDIDVDICQVRREEVIEYVRQRYGHDRVAQIITFGTLGAKAVLRDTARVMEIPIRDAERLAGLVPDQIKISLAESIEKVPELKELASGEFKSLFEVAAKLEGQVRHASRHAAGVVIGNVPITEVVPLYRDSDGAGHVVTQYDMISIEALGLLKIDMLGLKTLSVIARAEEIVAERTGKSLDRHEQFDDPAVYKMLSEARTLGVFQLDSSGIRDLMMKLSPGRFEDLVALIALYRPGPMNLADEFVARRHGRAPVVYEPKELEPILESTYGVILYQEQVMRIAHDIGGFSLADADNLRKAMGKKNPELMASFRDRFIRGAREKGFAKDVSEPLFDQMERFAGYGFNKSHAVAYAVIAYQTAWLKAHHPIEFMCALLTFDSDNHDKLGIYLQESARMGIAIFSPSVDRPSVAFVPAEEGGKSGIRYGMSAVKNVGVGAVEGIAEARLAGKFAGLWDLLTRIDHKRVNRRAIEVLIEVGALDGLGPNRASMVASLESLWDRSASASADSQQISLFGTRDLEPRIEEIAEFADRSEREAAYLGYYINGHPLLQKFPELALVKNPEVSPGSKTWFVGGISKVEEILDKRGKRMARVALTTLAGNLNLIVFSSVYESAKRHLLAGSGVFVRGKIEDAGRMLVDEIFPLNLVKWRLMVTVEDCAEEDLKAVELTLARSAGGDVPVDLIVKQAGKSFRLKSPHLINPSSIGAAFSDRTSIHVELLPSNR